MTISHPRAVPIPQVADAEAKQAQLDRMKRRAAGLLVAMSILFLVTLILEPRYPWLGYVRATAEAAMVGGLADWFAITALFRHPLNIPIPHTAIIPNRKDRIGRTLGNFVQHNFLSPEVLGPRLLALQPSRRAAEWLRQPEHARSLSQHAASALRSATEVVRDEDVHALLERSVIEPLRQRSIAPVLARGLVLLTSDDRHQQLLDRVIHGLAGLIVQNEDSIRTRIHDESPWWVPDFVDEKVHERVVAGIQRTLLEVSSDPGHPLRRQFDDLLTDWTVRLQESPEVIARADAVKQQIFDNPTSRGLSASLWDRGQEGARPPGRARTGGRPGRDGARTHRARRWRAPGRGTAVQAGRLDRGGGASGGRTAPARGRCAYRAHGSQLGSGGDLGRLELAVGRDLQFVRINGTLVGGLVGLLLYTASRLAGYGGH